MGAFLMLTETEERSASSLRCQIDGNLDEVITRMRELLKKYHPYGYGTQVDLGARPGSFDGRWRCIIKRSSSCD